MGDLWQEEGFGGPGTAGDGSGDDWDEGEESIELALEDGLEDPDELAEDEDWDEQSDG